MFEINFPDRFKEIPSDIDQIWLSSLINKLPFPIAYPLHRASQEDWPWHQVLKDLLNSILQFLALLSISEYIENSEQPDYDINESLQERIGRGISEGHWLKFLRTSVKKRGEESALPLLKHAFQEIEENIKVSIEDEEFAIKTEKLGLLSAWIKLRNSYVGHGRELSSDKQKERKDKIIKLVKLVLMNLEKISSYTYCQRIKGKKIDGIFKLKGIENFENVTFPEFAGNGEAFLIIDERKKEFLNLFPLYISLIQKEGSLGHMGEIYLINSIERKKAPLYLSPSGMFHSPKEMKEDIVNYFERKKIYEKRSDIELAEVYSFGLRKSQEYIEALSEQGLFLPDKYIDREQFETDIEEFLGAIKKKRSLLLENPGVGKLQV